MQQSRESGVSVDTRKSREISESVDTLKNRESGEFVDTRQNRESCESCRRSHVVVIIVLYLTTVLRGLVKAIRKSNI